MKLNTWCELKNYNYYPNGDNRRRNNVAAQQQLQFSNNQSMNKMKYRQKILDLNFLTSINGIGTKYRCAAKWDISHFSI